MNLRNNKNNFNKYGGTLIILASLVCRSNCESEASDSEVKLINYLFQHKGYNALIRPVNNLSEIIRVELGLAMIQIIHVKWKDFQLQWDPVDFDGLKIIRISASKVWKPDIVLFNNADGNYEMAWQPNILIEHTGDVLWIPPAIYKSSCQIDVTFFPFDQQECDMKFGSWTFDAKQVTLGFMENGSYVDLSDYWKSGAWTIVKCPGIIDDKSKPDQVQIAYTITLRRKTLFYTVNLIIPCVLTSFLSVCVFYLPSDAGEKIALCISILLALVVFLLLISKILPPTSISIPLISKYLLFTFIINIFAIFITVIIVNWNYRNPHTHIMPHWVRKIFMEVLPSLLFMKKPYHIQVEIRSRKERKWTSRQAVAMRHKASDRKPETSSNLIRQTIHQSIEEISHADEIQTIERHRSSFMSRGNHFYNHSTLHESTQIIPNDETIVSNMDNAINDSNLKQNAEEMFEPVWHHPKCKQYHPILHYQYQEGEIIIPPPNYDAYLSTVDQYNSYAEEEDQISSSTASEKQQQLNGGSSDTHVKDNKKVSLAEIKKCEIFKGIKITPDIREVISSINFISTHLETETEFRRILQDWKYVASVIDRIMLIIFAMVTIFGTVGILMNAPYILHPIDEDEVLRMYGAKT